MDTPGSEMSSDTTDSSSADTTSPDASPAQTVPQVLENQVPATTNTVSIIDDDSASDVSMSADSDDEDDENPNISTIQVNPVIQVLEQPTHLDPEADSSKKRKYPDSAEPNIHNGGPHEFRKRLRADEELQNNWTPDGHLPHDKSLLPAEIWHQIFTFCPPRLLGLLLQVNKSFNAYLDPSSSDHPITPLSRSAIQIMKPDAIWQTSRRLFRPGMPLPLIGKSELDMWKLACCFSCQFCGKKRSHQNPMLPLDQWRPGPGENGVVPIWSFGIRTCGPCLQQRSSKEIDLLLSSSIPSPLMAALPFVFLTNELHVIPSATLQNGQHPVGIQITKHFFQQHIEEIQKDFLEVKEMGSATVEEWLKGLDDRGKERRNDAARWERWEISGGVARMRNLEAHEVGMPDTRASSLAPVTASRHFTPLPVTNGTIPIFQGHNQHSTQYPPPQLPAMPQPIHNSFPTQPPTRFDSPSQNGFTYPPRPYPQLKQERTKDEVLALKAARRAEIERRCMMLVPPLTPGVLAHMGSFQAAIQIIQPLDDGAWEVLKPRLLSQREEAEQRENDRLAQTRVVQERFDERRYQDPQIKSESKDLVDREWDDIQAPLRARIGGYADETIRDGWNGGAKVSNEEAPRFAAEVLIYVRKRFYAEVAKDEAAVRATGREPEMDPPNGPFTRKLTLENMKWVFDTKIKPHTEQYRKELFLCSACENNFKFYGFEGVIQHFAAKHTNALSVGSIVVHWKSEWPEYPPFNPDPDAAKNSYYAAVPSASVPYASTGPPVPQNYGYGGYQPPVSASMQTPNPHVYQESPGPYYGHPQFSDQYSGHQNGPYAPPPQVYPEASQAYQAPQYSVAPPPNNLSGYSEVSQDYSQQGFGGSYAASYAPSTEAIYTSPHIGSLYPVSVPEPVTQQPLYAPQPQGGQYGQSHSQQSYPAPSYTPGPQRTEEYKTQLLEVARNAREVWNSINSVKEVPGSAKVYTIIYHLLKKSRANFQDDPPLSMIIDGLSNNKDMRPVRNINGLLCKACSLGMAGSTPAPQKKHFSFPQLLNHFHSVHEQGVSQNNLGHVPDWTKDMVDLPDQSRLASIVNAPGIDDQKLALFTEALPEIIAPPQPNVEDYHEGSNQEYGETVAQDPYGNVPPSQDNHDKYYAPIGSAIPSESGSGVYDNTQYDPRNPRDLREPQRDIAPLYRPSRRNGEARGEFSGESESLYKFKRRSLDPDYAYQDREERYVQRASSPPHGRPLEDYGRVIIREDAPMYLDKPIRYREVGDVEYRVRREPILAYDEPEPSYSRRDYRPANTQSYHSNGQDLPHLEAPSRGDHRQPSESDAVAKQRSIFEVVARISQHAQQAQEKLPAKEEPVEAGSEDGELRGEASSKPGASHMGPSDEASNAADRFLDEFLPGESVEEAAKKAEEAEHRKEDELRAKWEAERIDSMRHMYQPSVDPQRRVREVYQEDDRVVASDGRAIHPEEIARNGYIVHERVPPPRRTYAYDDRYVSSIPEKTAARERSPELVDRRYKLNNVVYRDERQASHGTHRTPSRYARYESVRLENDRARSRSPVYVKMGPQPGQYRERSPGAHPPHQEPIYRTRTPPATEEVTYERAPRQEYYRVYADEPRPRQPQYEEAFEYVQVSDPQGDYMIRRPVRREPQPVYAYEDEVYTRKPVYEARAPVSRSDPAYYEEYDPRHPAPPPAAAPVRQVRYQ